MKYRALIRIGFSRYYTEWLDTWEEVEHFKEDAGIQDILIYCFENEDHEEVEVR